MKHKVVYVLGVDIVIERVNISLSELHNAYKHNMTDMLKETCKYLLDFRDRSILLNSEVPEIVAYCDNHFVYKMKISEHKDTFILLLSYYVYVTADLIILSSEYTFTKISFFGEINIIDEYKNKKYHLADIQYRDSLTNVFKPTTLSPILGFCGLDIRGTAKNMVMGVADNLSPNSSKAGLIDRFDVILNDEFTDIPEFGIRHILYLTVHYYIEDLGRSLGQFKEWIKDTRIDARYELNIVVPCELLNNIEMYLTSEVLDAILDIADIFYSQKPVTDTICLNVCNSELDTKIYNSQITDLKMYKQCLEDTINELGEEDNNYWDLVYD